MLFACLSSMISVLLGAFAAHGLKSKLPENLLNTFETGVHYQFLHSLALLFLALFLSHSINNKFVISAGFLFTTGIFLFSGSLYTLALSEIRTLGHFPIGLITPIGGVSFILGWLLLAIGISKHTFN